jgi:4-alpha-glucanotransferase
MSEDALYRLAEAYGLQLSYQRKRGEWRSPSDDVKREILRIMGVAADSDQAIAKSLVTAPEPTAPIIAAPKGVQSFLPSWLSRERTWGITCQLYGLRSARNHGIGDFEDLARLAERAAADGADFVGINPVHALFTAHPERCSPFSPSNRRFLNPLYIALDRIPGTTIPPVVDETSRARLSARALVDYKAVADLKLGDLRMLWRRSAADPASWARDSRVAFQAFIEAGGAPLLAHARFEALSHHMVDHGKGAGWHGWPEAYRRADSPEVQRFADENDDEVQFHLWLQWIADTQLGAAAERARKAGMRIGLFLDLAVGNAPDGSATWSDPDLVVPGANIGAPPDSFFQAGQDWGLAPMSPAVLRNRNLTPYKDVLAIVMRHAGAVRIDHAMSLYRLFWIPHGRAATEGCYVRYPLPDMLKVVAEVSNERRATVIGEDLGTVPKGFSETMRDLGMLSYRVLYFEHVRGGFRAAASYPRNAFVTASTHDLPPLAAWWAGDDLELFRSLGHLDAAGLESRRSERTRDRRALLAKLEKESARRPFANRPPSDESATGDSLTEDLAAGIHAFLARTPCRLLGVQFEDLCGAEAPVNVPGTNEEYPNWRLRAPATIEDAVRSRLWSAVVGAVAHERPRRG